MAIKKPQVLVIQKLPEISVKFYHLEPDFLERSTHLSYCHLNLIQC